MKERGQILFEQVWEEELVSLACLMHKRHNIPLQSLPALGFTDLASSLVEDVPWRRIQ